MSLKISITANGEAYEMTAGSSVGDFLTQRGLSPRHVVVERNGRALSPSEAPATPLENGDVLEIVRIVAGG